MYTKNIKNTCKLIRLRLARSIAKKINFQSGWLHHHIGTCPKCQQRLGLMGNVNLALQLLKSQPHNFDLLMRANTQTVNVLKHSLRETNKAAELKTAQPEPGRFFRYMVCSAPLLKTAACIFIILLLKIGVFESIDSTHKRGDAFMKNYYTQHLGEDMANEIFNV